MRPVMDDPAYAGTRFGYRAHWPEVHVKWSVPAPHADARADEILARVRGIFGEAIFGEGKDELAAVVVRQLSARGERAAFAESCTGGLVSALLTEVPGSSEVFDFAGVTYANTFKSKLLGVKESLLAEHGAVSEPVARAMAEGIRAYTGATWGIGITGIAGPGGGTDEKPVGTVHLALAGPSGTEHSKRCYRLGDRARIRQRAAYEALDWLRRATRARP
jgi:nicotinamide-nucleotide amidase